MASLEGNWCGSALFVIKYVNLNLQPKSNEMIDELEVDVVSQFI